MIEHPSDQVIAAFLDRRLSLAERNLVIAHMADCVRCRSIVTEVMRTTADLEVSQPIDPRRGGVRRSIIDAILIGATIAVVLLVACP